MYAIIDKKTGKELYYKADNEVNKNQVAVTELRNEDMEEPYYDFETKTFYENAKKINTNVI
jgi:hypothetical protein